WVRSLTGRILAWSPGTNGETVSGEVIALPEHIADSNAFKEWLPKVKGKFVLTSMPQITGRPDRNWEKFATDESFEKMKKERAEQQKEWRKNMRRTGYNSRTLPKALEKAGAAGVLISYCFNGFGANKVFDAHTTRIHREDINLEDNGLLYQLEIHGNKLVINHIA